MLLEFWWWGTVLLPELCPRRVRGQKADYMGLEGKMFVCVLVEELVLFQTEEKCCSQIMNFLRVGGVEASSEFSTKNRKRKNKMTVKEICKTQRKQTILKKKKKKVQLSKTSECICSAVVADHRIKMIK